MKNKITVTITLGRIIEVLGGSLEGGMCSTEIERIAPLENADERSISFLSNPRYAGQLATSRAACVIIAPAMRALALERGACIVTDNPYAYFARLTQMWQSQLDCALPVGIHPTAVVDAEAQIHQDAVIGPLCVVERGAVIGAGTVLRSRVTVGQNCTIGSRCILHPGVVVGADGFGFAPQDGEWVKIAQLGAVHIGDDVEIGANTCIDRGALEDTVIADGVKIDNLVQIAHNVHIGAHTVIAGNTGIAGSTKIGAHCSIGGAANILGHLTIADGTSISPTSMVTRSIHKPDLYTGIFPLQTNAEWEKNAASFKQLHQLRERVKKIEKALDASKESKEKI